MPDTIIPRKLKAMESNATDGKNKRSTAVPPKIKAATPSILKVFFI